MKEWQFFLEQTNKSTLIPINTRDSRLSPGCYRILAQTNLTQTPIHIDLSYQMTGVENTRGFKQKYVRSTNVDGFLIITPFLDLAEGCLQLKCKADVLTELTGNYWERLLNLEITAIATVSNLTEQQLSCQLILNQQNLVQSNSGTVYLSGEFITHCDNLSHAFLTYQLYNPKTGRILIERNQSLAVTDLPGQFEYNLALNPYWDTCLILGELSLEIFRNQSSFKTYQNFKIITNPIRLLQRFKQLQYQVQPSVYRPVELIDFKNQNKIIDVQQTEQVKDSLEKNLEQSFAQLELQKRFWERLNKLANHQQ